MIKYYFFTVLVLYISNSFALFPIDEFLIPIKENSTIPATEDLIKAHGILHRVLLIYQEIISRIDSNIDFSIETLAQAVAIIKSFMQNYHEKLEEEYIFPIFERNKKEIRLVKILKNQHIKGREITSRLQQLIASSPEKNKKKIKNLLQQFIAMYRPHLAREDTVLFPKVRSLISEEEFKKISKTFEDVKQTLFGKHGLEAITKKVVTIEKKLGIYKLDQFTPKKV